ncbi:hypothetical protein [Micromonospora sp. NPDC047527]|uniref:hypothetical protein n=1 Tax=unclassified Micromonospora TaxID=2617518 RepID=UPI003410669E
MRTFTHRIAAGLAVALITTLTATLPAAPAAAGEPFQSPDKGLVFYSSYPTEVAGRQAAPDGVCRQIPADATWLLAWSGGFRSVPGYRTPDCSGQASELNNFHSWPKGRYLTYRAS